MGNQNKNTSENLHKMKLISIFALIAATMVVSTEALKIETKIDAPQPGEGINLELAEVEGWHSGKRSDKSQGLDANMTGGGGLAQISSKNRAAFVPSGSG